MMKSTKIATQLLGLSLGVMGLFYGCSEKLEPKPPTYSQLLTGTDKKTWRLVSVEVVDQGQKSGVIPIQNAYNTCEADDQFIFYADAGHKFQCTNGATKCSAAEPDTLIDDNWALINSNASLEFVIPVFANSVLPYTIKNLTATSMTVEIYFDKVFVDPIDVSYRYTFNSTTK
jgi:hypothetical protein